ncbi:MAG: tRNA (adenosine(37)-N6)-threonylcarbamoyltransferase complex transferase subunit TsaD [Anaerolineae bacterium]|nr:MAG: tRNA (adenosine(37)-N6)-threonylcarbamoyltransferase complex transferase subunit TsaD [Anaerolineae bacterium]
MRILAIESSCDETAAAIVEDGRKLLSNAVASQVDLHARYGGVFPEMASRQHVLSIYPIVQQALREAHLSLDELDAIAVTRGPGLPGSLVVGLNAAKGLALGSGLPLVGVNHLEGHIYAAWLYREEPAPPEPQFPILALIVSGGHTELILIREHLQYQRLGGTLDDAAGEAFDKAARMLGLGYPGGPAIQQAGKEGDPRAFDFPRAWLGDSWDFSFSGLKTAVLRQVQALQKQRLDLPVADLAASFEAAVVEVLTVKTMRAAERFGARSVLVAGGVSANQRLREEITRRSPLPVHIPPLAFCTDNAAMIAAAGCRRFAAGQRDGMSLDVLPTWPLSEV